MHQPRPLLGYAGLLAGAAAAYLGAFVGGAASATNEYGSLLRVWAAATFLAVFLFAMVMGLDRGWRRLVSLGLLLVTIIVGLSPARRLLALGWSAP